MAWHLAVFVCKYVEIHGNPWKSTKSTLQNLICYRMSVSRASGTPCCLVFGRFCVSRCRIGVTFGVNFHENYGRQWPESEKWTPKAAYRRRFARLMRIISPCVRSKRAHKQEIHILLTFLSCHDGPEHAIGANDRPSRTGWEGVGGG